MMIPVNEATLEQRVAALEERLTFPLLMVEAPEWTDEQAETFQAEFGRQLRSGEFRWLPPGSPLLTPETARALLRECVTVVSPGETLVIRVPDTWTAQQADVYQEYADAATASGRIPFPVLVVLGAELGVARVEPGNPAPVER